MSDKKKKSKKKIRTVCPEHHIAMVILFHLFSGHRRFKLCVHQLKFITSECKTKEKLTTFALITLVKTRLPILLWVL